MTTETTKNAFCPKPFAACAPTSHEGNKKGDMGFPVKVLTLAAVQSSIEKQPVLKDQVVTETAKDKDNDKAKTLAAFLTESATVSERQGYLSMADLTKIANVSQINTKAGTADFQALIRRLISRGYIANDQGRAAKELGEINVDLAELDF